MSPIKCTYGVLAAALKKIYGDRKILVVFSLCILFYCSVKNLAEKKANGLRGYVVMPPSFVVGVNAFLSLFCKSKLFLTFLSTCHVWGFDLVRVC